MERAKEIKTFLKTDFVEIREVIVAQWGPIDGSFWSGEVNTHDQGVYDALKMADRWRAVLVERVKVDERAAASKSQGQA